MTRITLEIEPELKRRLRMRVAEDGRTISDVMREFCELYADVQFGGIRSWGERAALPEVPAIYFVYGERELLYVGQTTNLRQRLCIGHHRDGQFADNFLVLWVHVPDEERSRIEGELIKAIEPRLNSTPNPGILIVRVPDDLYEAIRGKAECTDITVSQAVRRFLRRWVLGEIDATPPERKEADDKGG